MLSAVCDTIVHLLLTPPPPLFPSEHAHATCDTAARSLTEDAVPEGERAVAAVAETERAVAAVP